jgi:predicted TIM-barrel fold metal-dependent hydrolase
VALKVIDMHAHFFPDALAKRAVDNLGNYYHVKMHCDGTYNDLTKRAEEAGITKLVIHSTALKPSQVEVINDNTASHTKENISGFGTLHQDYEGDFEKEIKRIKSLGLKGIKLHPDFQNFNIDDKKMYPVYDIIRAEKLPILFHTGDIDSPCSSPKRLRKVLDDFPGLIAIGAHLGGHDQWEEAREYLYGRDVYIDTSSCHRSLSHKEIKDAIRAHDIDKIMFGTDYPIENYEYCLENFFKLGLTDEENEKILYKNANRLIFDNQD